MKLLLGLVLFASACGQVVHTNTPEPPVPVPPGGDGRCNPDARFASPIGRDFATTSTGGATGAFTLVGDELEAVVASGGELLSASRSTTADDFDAVSPLFPPDPRNDDLASYTADGLRLYLRGDGFLVVATRDDRGAPFDGGGQVTVGGVPILVAELTISANGERLYYVDAEDTAGLLRVATRVDDLTFSAGIAISETAIARPVISANEMRLYHANGGDIFAAARGDLDEVFGFGEPVAELNTDAFEAPLAVSLDECALFFQSGRAGHAGLSDVWRTQRPR